MDINLCKRLGLSSYLAFSLFFFLLVYSCRTRSSKTPEHMLNLTVSSWFHGNHFAYWYFCVSLRKAGMLIAVCLPQIAGGLGCFHLRSCLRATCVGVGSQHCRQESSGLSKNPLALNSLFKTCTACLPAYLGT